MDAAVKENVKWMMSYIADYTGDIPGSLFMALQTYIWDHQSDKSAGGDTSGDIDAGGFANADTYETYVGYYNWMLAQKAKEDAELQKQIEEYTAQGKQASHRGGHVWQVGRSCHFRNRWPPELLCLSRSP